MARGGRDSGAEIEIPRSPQAPNQFSMLVSDPTDGTPIAFCSGRKVFIYDPVGPTVYYSEDAVFTINLTCTRTEFKFDFRYWTVPNGVRHRIFLDFPSVLLMGSEPSAEGAAVLNAVATRGPNEFELIRTFPGTRHSQTFQVDLIRECPYAAAAFSYDGVTPLCFDRLILNHTLGDGNFSFPTKRRLRGAVPVKDITADPERAKEVNWDYVFRRAAVVRGAINRAGPPGAPEIPGLALDWDRVRKNDKRYAKALRDLVPATLRAP